MHDASKHYTKAEKRCIKGLHVIEPTPGSKPGSTCLLLACINSKGLLEYRESNFHSPIPFPCNLLEDLDLYYSPLVWRRSEASHWSRSRSRPIRCLRSIGESKIGSVHVHYPVEQE